MTAAVGVDVDVDDRAGGDVGQVGLRVLGAPDLRQRGLRARMRGLGLRDQDVATQVEISSAAAGS